MWNDLTAPWNHLWSLAPRAVLAAAILAAFWGAASLAGRFGGRIGGLQDPERQQALELLARVLKVTLLVLGAVSALGTLGINVSALVAGLGLTGFALGFALKDALSNLLAGVLLVVYRPFRREDHITVAGFEGRVVDLDLRYTTLRADGRRILIPNALLFTNSIVAQESGTDAA